MKELTPHPHAHILRAIADGKTVEVRKETQKWWTPIDPLRYVDAGVMQRDAGYVYADQLLKAHLDQLISEGWRQCAKGQGTSQFCEQLEEAVKALQIENEQLRAERNRSGVELRNAVSKAVLAEREAWPNLQPVIEWLENGCDPKDAAKELRSYDEAIRTRSDKPGTLQTGDHIKNPTVLEMQ